MLTALKLLISFVSLAIALIPVWFFMFIEYLLAPEGFWQNLVLYGLGFWAFGFFQFILLAIWLWFAVFVWSAPELKKNRR